MERNGAVRGELLPWWMGATASFRRDFAPNHHIGQTYHGHIINILWTNIDYKQAHSYP